MHLNGKMHRGTGILFLGSSSTPLFFFYFNSTVDTSAWLYLLLALVIDWRPYIWMSPLRFDYSHQCPFLMQENW
jgi:hypothetical protein